MIAAAGRSNRYTSFSTVTVEKAAEVSRERASVFHEHRAGTALAPIAPRLGFRQPHLVAQCIEEGCARRAVDDSGGGRLRGIHAYSLEECCGLTLVQNFSKSFVSKNSIALTIVIPLIWKYQV